MGGGKEIGGYDVIHPGRGGLDPAQAPLGSQSLRWQPQVGATADHRIRFRDLKGSYSHGLPAVRKEPMTTLTRGICDQR